MRRRLCSRFPLFLPAAAGMHLHSRTAAPRSPSLWRRLVTGAGGGPGLPGEPVGLFILMGLKLRGARLGTVSDGIYKL